MTYLLDTHTCIRYLNGRSPQMMIAAIALTHGLTLVTHNTREFERVAGLSLADWEE